MSQEPRCASCGALLAAQAEWCGQCYAPVLATAEGRVRAPAAALAAAEERGIQVEEGRTTWACPACGTRNLIEAGACSACGTPFGRLFEEPAVRPEIEPRAAAAWSMLLPGLGHWRLGRKGDAVARFALFGWSFGALLILVASRVGKGGLGPTFPLFLLFLGASAAIYVTSAVDAYRIAAGNHPLVHTRALLWGSLGVIVLSVVIATLITLPAARR